MFTSFFENIEIFKYWNIGPGESYFNTSARTQNKNLLITRVRIVISHCNKPN